MTESLTRIQALFWRAITWPTGVSHFLEQTDPATRCEFEATFLGDADWPALERLSVYAEVYFWRLHDALKEQFPVVHFLATKLPFRNLITDYVLEKPPKEPDLRRIGSGFSDYLSHHSIILLLPHLEELAKIEWAICELLDAPDVPVFKREALEGRPPTEWPDLVFVPAPAMRLCSSHWDYAALKRAQERAAECDTSTVESGVRLDDSKLLYFLIWRREYQIFHRRVKPPERRALQAMMAGASFASLCAEAHKADPTLRPESVADWLEEWIHSGLIGGMKTLPL
ncbi:MAG TPA: DNA-binding domain-containing protein [Polyangiaceae bacterium]